MKQLGMRSTHLMIKRTDISSTAALVISYKLITGCGTPLEKFTNVHIIYLMCEVLTISKIGKNLSVGFDRSLAHREAELTGNKPLLIKRTLHVRTF